MKFFSIQKPKTRATLLSALLASLCLSLPVIETANAQTDTTIDKESEATEQQGYGNEGRWFQIEILIFTQSDQQNQQETWPTNIALAYPPNWKQLESFDPETQMEQHPDPALFLATEPYYSLPSEERLLNNNLRDLENSPRNRVLYHQAWRQQVWGIDEAPSLLIQGGQQYGNHYELEGSINLSVARYLHLKTNLWFTEFENNFGQEANDYPPLPELPSLTQETLEQDLLGETQSPWDRIEITASEYEKILDEPYVSRRIITMKQKRRMRSKEIHYVDHPVIGMIVYIVPYELPEIEEPAEELGEVLETDADGTITPTMQTSPGGQPALTTQ